MIKCGVWNLNHHSDGTWTWTFHDGFGERSDYRTDKYGDGLWVADRSNCEYIYDAPEWKQVRGTCDFSLKGMSYSGAYKKIRRELQ